jgi:vacuolar-type H+-ATPase subunit H
MPTEIRETIREIEDEAEQLIEKARADAGVILEDASKKAREILSAELLVDEFTSECDGIVSGAQEEAQGRVEEARKVSAGIRSASSEKIDKLSQLMADQIRGIN